MSENDLLQLYLSTEVHFVGRDGVLYKTAARNGSTEGPNVSQMLAENAIDAWVITAWNPLSTEREPDLNELENAELRAALVSHGFSPIEAEGRAPDGTWAESSFLVWASDETECMQLRALITVAAHRYRQNAVFRFIGNQQLLVPMLDRRFEGARSYSLLAV